MNKIFTALVISLIPLVSAHAGLVKVENRVSCYLALDGNEGLKLVAQRAGPQRR